MKKFLFNGFAAILTLAFIHPLVRAQGVAGDSLDIQSTQAVAFLKTDRSILYIKRPGQPVDAYDLQQLDTAGFDPNPWDSIRNIGVIGMTPQGDRIVIGATVYYLNQTNSTHDRFVGFLSIPWPMTPNSIHGTPGIVFLVPTSSVSFRPSGVISANGTEWWAVGSSSSQGSFPLVFYHGRTDGTGSFDSAQVTSSLTGNSALDVYQVSNIGIDQGSKEMFATSFDGLQSQHASGRAFFYEWNPDKGIGLSAQDFTGSMKALNQKVYGGDSIYGITVAPAEDGQTAYIGLTPSPEPSPDIGLYPVLYTNPGINVPSEPTYTIPQFALPANENFFAGPNCGPYSETIGYTNACSPGNSGDVSFSVMGDTALFITHDWPDTCSNRDKESAIWTYDLKQNTISFIYNDSSAQELQPVFVTANDTIPHSPVISQDVTTKDFTSIDTGKTMSEIINITDASIFDETVLDSAKITGTNASDFTITSPTPASFPFTLNRRASVPISITFAPTMTAGPRTAKLTVYSTRSTDDSVSVSLTGTSQVLQGNGSVADDPALEANMAIDPNPFSSQTSVRLTAEEAGTLGIIVHDALGRLVYTSEIRHASAGATEDFTFDAKSLGLANGVYIVTGLFGDRSASHQVVLTR